MKDIDYLKKYLKPEKLEEGIKKLNKKVPVQYIVGNVNFYGIELDVNENVLIPRFETETLVEKTIKYVKEYLKEPINIIDLGTGSGAIAITLKKHLNCKIDAIDISQEALEVAKTNAKKNTVEINFFQNNMLDNITKKYDLIISNPPYISYDEQIEDIVKNNEPSIALYADNKGLEFYEKILKKAKENTKEKSIIAFEIGMNQGKDVYSMAKKYIKNSTIKIEKDLTGKDRYLFIFIG